MSNQEDPAGSEASAAASHRQGNLMHTGVPRKTRKDTVVVPPLLAMGLCDLFRLQVFYAKSLAN